MPAVCLQPLRLFGGCRDTNVSLTNMLKCFSPRIKMLRCPRLPRDFSSCFDSNTNFLVSNTMGWHHHGLVPPMGWYDHGLAPCHLVGTTMGWHHHGLEPPWGRLSMSLLAIASTDRRGERLSHDPCQPPRRYNSWSSSSARRGPDPLRPLRWC